MNKPFATLGDALAAKDTPGIDWRSQLKAEDIPIRTPRYTPPPPSSRPASQQGPDRGYVEQPAERIATTQIPLVMLRKQMPLPVPPPEAEPPASTEVTEVPKAKKSRQHYSDEFRAKIIAEALSLGQGGQAVTARKHKLDQSIISLWIKNAKKRGTLPPASGVSSTRTLVSPPSSGPVSVGADTQLTMPTISIPGLPEYIRAIVREEVKAELRRRLSGD